MYTCGLDSSRHGCRATPSTPVISPPVRNDIQRGAVLEKSYDGLTTFAATLTETVATSTVSRPRMTTAGLDSFVASCTGSQIVAWYSACAPEVMRMASRQKKVIVVGRPSTWPTAWPRWLRENLVKSGMFSDSVDQNAIIAISDGQNTLQNGAPQPRWDGCDSSGPRPPALTAM